MVSLFRAHNFVQGRGAADIVSSIIEAAEVMRGLVLAQWGHRCWKRQYHSLLYGGTYPSKTFTHTLGLLSPDLPLNVMCRDPSHHFPPLPASQPLTAAHACSFTVLWMGTMMYMSEAWGLCALHAMAAKNWALEGYTQFVDAVWGVVEVWWVVERVGALDRDTMSVHILLKPQCSLNHCTLSRVINKTQSATLRPMPMNLSSSSLASFVDFCLKDPKKCSAPCSLCFN